MPARYATPRNTMLWEVGTMVGKRMLPLQSAG